MENHVQSDLLEQMLANNPQLANLNPSDYRSMQSAPKRGAGTGAVAGGLAGGGLGALFAKLTGKAHPLLGLGLGVLGGAGIGALGGGLTGSAVKNIYNGSFTPEEARYMILQDPQSGWRILGGRC